MSIFDDLQKMIVPRYEKPFVIVSRSVYRAAQDAGLIDKDGRWIQPKTTGPPSG